MKPSKEREADIRRLARSTKVVVNREVIIDLLAALDAERERVKGLENAERNSLKVLASALHKIAPELTLELIDRWNVANGEAEAALEDFLKTLRAAKEQA